MNELNQATNKLRTGNEFHFDGDLTKRKIKQFFPAMLLTNISTLLLITVDGLVVGNFCGSEALSSVSIFQPATAAIGVLSCLLSSGAATRLSEGMGKIDLNGLRHTRSTLKILLIIMAIFITVAQIPLVYAIISSYHLSPEMNTLVWSYAIGVMISSPLGMVSNMGVLQLQIIGKMKVLMGLAALEGGVNLALDLLFVGPLDMGVAGAGYGTACANLVRCTTTLIYLIRKTDLFKTDGEKPSLREAKEIIVRGLPDAANSIMLTLQNYAIVAILLSAFGESGGVIKGVCTFALSLLNVLIMSVTGSVRPICGLFCGAKNYKGLRVLMRQGVIVVTALSIIFLVLVESFPTIIYSIHGVKSIPEGGIASLRIFSIYFICIGVNELLRLYFSNRKIYKFSTILTIVGNATLPLFALIFSKLFAPPWIFLSYLVSQLILVIANVIRYYMEIARDNKREETETDIYITVSPNEAVACSRQIRAFASEHNINNKHAFRAALCVEEMAAYAKKTHESQEVDIQVMIRFLESSAILMIIDDGKCIYLDDEKANQKIITSNYGLLKKLSKTVEYQYVLDMNYTVCRYA